MHRLALLLLALAAGPLAARSPFAGPWFGQRTYTGRAELGTPEVEAVFSPAGNPILFGVELTKVGQAFAYRTDTDVRVVEVAQLDAGPARVALVVTVAALPLAEPGKKPADKGVLVAKRTIAWTLQGDEVEMTESEATVEGTTLASRAVLTRGLSRALLGGFWVGKVGTKIERVQFSARGFPVIGGVEIAKVGDAGATKLDVARRRVALTVGSTDSTFVLDEKSVLHAEVGGKRIAFVRPVRVAGKWEGPAADSKGEPLASATFEFAADGMPILYGERRTQTGRTIKFTPQPVGSKSEILRGLDITRGFAEFQIRYITNIVVDELFKDIDHTFVPRDDSDDEIDFRMSRNQLDNNANTQITTFYRGKLKRVGPPPLPDPATLPDAAGPLPAVAPEFVVTPVVPLAYQEPSSLAGTWNGRIATAGKEPIGETYEFGLTGQPLYGYRPADGLRRTVPITGKGQRFAYDHADLHHYAVEVRESVASAAKVAYTLRRAKTIGKSNVGTNESLSRSFTVKGNDLVFEMRYAAGNQPVEVTKGTFQKAGPFGGKWGGEAKRNFSTFPESGQILDGGRPTYFVTDGLSRVARQVELTHIGQRVDVREYDGGSYTVVVKELTATPFQSLIFVEQIATPADPAKPPKRTFMLRGYLRFGEQVQFVVRTAPDEKLETNMAETRGLFQRK